MTIRSAFVPILSLSLLPACLGAPDTPPLQLELHVDVPVVPGNPTCDDLGLGDFSIKVDPPHSGTYALDDENSVTVTIDGLMVSWSSTIGIDAVLVKGGPNAALYLYDPEAVSGSGLHAPINPNNDTPYDVSHVSFCYDYELVVSKTAAAWFDRSHSWSIAKAVDQGSLLLSAGQVYMMGYAVQVTMTGSTDSGWAASGTITVHNPSPFPASVTEVTDLIDGTIEVAVDCAVSFPYQLAAHQSLSCSYQTALPDDANRTNVASATSSGGWVGSGSGSAVIDFASATVNGIDECVDVDDTLAGPLGTVCAGDAGLFEYQLAIGPYQVCGSDHQVVNTASFEACDTGQSGSDSATVEVEIADCDLGCTLTQGYWKTHSSYGPAPYDSTWALLPQGADTPFFLSGKSWIGAFWTAPAGNPYWILARQYMAAVLNGLNGADPSAVEEQLALATALLEAHAPGDVTSRQRKAFVDLASALDAYNNGVTGPGHCDE
jgi:hypothetical protein